MTISTEDLRKLLGEATPGPWHADGDPWNRIVWTFHENRVCFMSHSSGLDDARDIATSELVAASPALAAELLAARAKIEAAEKLAEALGACVTSLERASTEEGVCCCGDNMDGHSDPMNCGHSPVDMGDYYASNAITAARTALAAWESLK